MGKSGLAVVGTSKDIPRWIAINEPVISVEDVGGVGSAVESVSRDNLFEGVWTCHEERVVLLKGWEKILRVHEVRGVICRRGGASNKLLESCLKISLQKTAGPAKTSAACTRRR